MILDWVLEFTLREEVKRSNFLSSFSFWGPFWDWSCYYLWNLGIIKKSLSFFILDCFYVCLWTYNFKKIICSSSIIFFWLLIKFLSSHFERKQKDWIFFNFFFVFFGRMSLLSWQFQSLEIKKSILFPTRLLHLPLNLRYIYFFQLINYIFMISCLEVSRNCFPLI